MLPITTTTTITTAIRLVLLFLALGCALPAQAAGPYPDPPVEPAWAADEETALGILEMEGAVGAPAPPMQRLPTTGRGRVVSPPMLESGLSTRDSAPTEGRPGHDPLPWRWEGGARRPDAPLLAAVDLPPLVMLYAQRAGETLPLFGHTLFGQVVQPLPPEPIGYGPEEDAKAAAQARAPRNTDAVPLGALSEDLVLRTGDKVEVVFSGQRSDRDVHRVNAQGLLLIPDFPPIAAAGRRLAEVRAALEAEVAEMRNTQVHVAVFSVAQISVLVTGHVRTPGRQRLTAFNTALDALIAAGGVVETGSLRAITLRRGGKALRLDLYDVLLESPGESVAGCAAPDAPLQDGDVLIVPPIGPTVAAAGDVGRPAIYELSSEGARLSLEGMLTLAGGTLAPGANRFMRLTSTPDGREETQSLSQDSDASVLQFGPGDILMVVRGEGRPAGQVRLAGATRRPGVHVLARAGTLAQLLSGPEVLGEDVYPLIAVLERRAPRDAGPAWRVFSPVAVLAGRHNAKLQEGDTVHLFSRAQIRALFGPALRQDSDPETAHCTWATSGGLVGRVCGGAEDRVRDPAIAALLRERAAYVRGGVRLPGPWPLAGPVDLPTLIAAAGGVTDAADTDHIEVTRLDHTREAVRLAAGLAVGPGDTVQVAQKRDLAVAGDTIWIGGEVVRPGTYGMVAGETLSDLISRAGGLTRQAYPEGAVFSRADARQAEEARYRAAAMDIERAVALARARESDSRRSRARDREPEDSEAKVLMAQALADELRSVRGLGRVPVEARPDVLATQPALDTVLAAGDRLYIPPRPASVRVAGEVLSPGFLPFRSGKSARDYIGEAAGTTYFADKARSFVLFPDGTAQRLHISAWDHSPILIPPGSTIVVPRDPRPFDFIATTRDLSQIIANLAITAIFIDDLANK
ncbi:MAG TPA: polysaccharide biosynthesis/export family protein [Rhodospirillaceae bacterium]|jgi:polysaccharide export outer membrane protein|nr:SLBB domain-containing protein [Alphaproteobacteria bacterium]HBH26443.1 polysaccharide biosynthesis/export family protein [Rhodospirillaceae bacterium]